MRALHDVVQAGYVRYIGMSSCWAWQCITLFTVTLTFSDHSIQSILCKVCGNKSCLAPVFIRCEGYAIQSNLTPFISMQNHHSLVYREEEREMMPTLQYFGVGCTPWSPLARGLLTRPLSEQTKRGLTDMYVNRHMQPFCF